MTDQPEIIDVFASDLRPLEYWAMVAGDKLQQWATGEAEGYSTGFRDIDKYSRLVDAQLMIIAARPSMGKTALGMQMAQTVARQMQRENEDGCVAVFSAEMAGWQLVLRMASAACGVDSHDIVQGHGDPEEIRILDDALQKLRHLPIWIDDCSGPTTQQMLEQLTRLTQSVPVRMMLFDFMELGGDRHERSEERRISQIAQNLKGIAKTLSIPVVALSQLNRDVEHRSNKMPQLSDLRHSGMIEQIADVVLVLMRPEYYVERGIDMPDIPIEDQKGVAYVQVVKNRNGPVGIEKLAFRKGTVQFGDLIRKEVGL